MQNRALMPFLVICLNLVACSDMEPASDFHYVPEHDVAERHEGDATVSAEQRQTLHEKRQAAAEQDVQIETYDLLTIVLTTADVPDDLLTASFKPKNHIEIITYDPQDPQSIADALIAVLQDFDDDLAFEVVAPEDTWETVDRFIEAYQLEERFVSEL